VVPTFGVDRARAAHGRRTGRDAAHGGRRALLSVVKLGVASDTTTAVALDAPALITVIW